MIKLIKGRFDNGMSFFWKVDGRKKISLGDQVIVENRDGYALVEVVAIAYVLENCVNAITNSDVPLKSVIQKIELPNNSKGAK